MGLSRAELWTALGLSMRGKVVDGMLEQAYTRMEHEVWSRDLDSAPHGEPWHTSFHASRFPGDDPMACGRQALYDLLGAPRDAPFDRRGRTIMDAGKDIEVQLVRRLHYLGVLVSEPPWSPVQTVFVIPDVWLTGAVDVAVLPEGYVSPHPVEIKGKDDDVVSQMRRGERSWDPAHAHQLKTYIGMAHDLAQQVWPLLQPAHDGTLLYVSRNRPYNTHEYAFAHDPMFMALGYARLREWKGLFLSERLPPRDKSWRWTEHPCRWCHWKRVCKADTKAGVSTLPDSGAVSLAKKTSSVYDYDRSRSQVLGRWNVDNHHANVA